MTELDAQPPSRNAPCPCGSGKRYKECHGSLAGASGASPLPPKLPELLASALRAQQQGRLDDAQALYQRVLAMSPDHFDAMHMLGVVHLQKHEFAQAHAMISAARALRPEVRAALQNLQLVEAALRRGQSRERYRRWIADVEAKTDRARAELRRAVSLRAGAPRFSILLPTFNSEPRWLAACIESVLAQTYPHWELCLADDASTREDTRQAIARFATFDDRVRVAWRERNGHISAASNSALALATAPYVALLDHDDLLAAAALAEMALAVIDAPNAAILYSDEDKIDENGLRSQPYFKPAWNPVLARGQNCVSHLGVYRTELLREAGGFREGYEGAQDWDLLLRCSERVADSDIRRVPYVLYHWRTIAGSTARSMSSKHYAAHAQERAVEAHLSRIGWPGAHISRISAFLDVDPVLERMPSIALIVLCRPGIEAEPAIARWREHVPRAVDVVAARIEGDVANAYDGRAMALGRMGARAIGERVDDAAAELIVIVPATATPHDARWLDRLAAHGMRPETACIGGTIVDAEDRIAGGAYVLNEPLIASTAFHGNTRVDDSMADRALLAQNVSAVRLDCFAVRRDAWKRAGGLDTALHERFHDVDLCLRLARSGVRSVWHPGIVLVDALARIAADERQVRIESDDAELMRSRYALRLADDPAYNPNLSPTPPLFEPRLDEPGRA